MIRRDPALCIFAAGAEVGVGRDQVPIFKVGDRVRFLFDQATGTIVRAFRGLVPGDLTYVIHLDQPDENGRLRAAWAGEIE